MNKNIVSQERIENLETEIRELRFLLQESLEIIKFLTKDPEGELQGIVERLQGYWVPR
jgi:hypothetical protein